MLIRVKKQDWSASFAYAPPLVEAVLNTDHIVSVVSVESRGSGPFVCVSMVDGQKLTCEGEPSDFAPQQLERRP